MMDPVAQALRDPRTLDEALGEDADPTFTGVYAGAGAGYGCTISLARRLPVQEVLTIDMDLPAVHAVEPKPKGPRWRLGEFRASARRLEAMTPLERDRVRRRARQWLGDL